MALPQQFSISLAGTTYNFRLTWCPPAAAWMLDIFDQYNNPLLRGTPLLPGALILGQYRYLEIPGDLFVQNSCDCFTPPTWNELGDLSNLYFINAATLAAANVPGFS